MTIPSVGRRLPDAEKHRVARAPRRGSVPLVSVVVASNGDWRLLQRCLASLVEPCLRLRAEVVVARAGVGPEIDTLARMYPTVGFVEGEPAASIAQLRALGMREATGDIVVLTEDDVTPDVQWLDTFARHAEHDGASTRDSGQGVDRSRPDRGP